MTVVAWAALTFLSAIVGAELVAWSGPIQRALIRRAAAVLPKNHAARYIEEWYGELERLPDGPATRLFWVASLVLRRGALARELGVSRSMVGFTGGLKRTLDLGMTGLGLVVISPVLLVIALAVKLDSGGPILFRQTRVGHDGSTFTMLKFRSMHPDAEKRLAALRTTERNMGFQFKMHDDPRITRVGRFLRRFALDELPQLLNVMTGDMSLVGPRPSLPSEVAHFDDVTKEKLQVTPGLTGMWQVSSRSAQTWEDMNELDLYYAKNWTLTLDLLIIWKTCVSVLSRRH